MTPEKNPVSRREFIANSLFTASMLPFIPRHFENRPEGANTLKVFVFSKHLQFLSYKEMAEAAADIGFDGVDLTVRPNGHVLPERVESDLPAAVEAIRKAGLSYDMMTTAVADAKNPTDRKVLETAARAGIKYYRMNWFPYPEGSTIPEAIEQFQRTIADLSALNRKLNIVGVYQNHSGLRAGASIWELWDMVQKADKQFMGVQYDIRHAVVEGGFSWQNGLRLIHPEIKILAIKDFVWTKKDGRYVVENVPLGQGMIDFKLYFSMLREFKINVPVSLHFEYPLGGAEHGAPDIKADRKVVFDAMRRDLKWLRDTWAAV